MLSSNFLALSIHSDVQTSNSFVSHTTDTHQSIFHAYINNHGLLGTYISTSIHQIITNNIRLQCNNNKIKKTLLNTLLYKQED